MGKTTLTLDSFIDHLEALMARMQRYGIDSDEVDRLIESTQGRLRNRLRNIRDNMHYLASHTVIR